MHQASLTPTRANILALLTAFVTLFAQVLVHRLISAKLVNNYAFLVISLTMLGFAVSGVLLSRFLPAVTRRLPEVSAGAAGLFAMSAIIATSVFFRLEAGPQFAFSRRAFVAASLHWTAASLLFTIPFACCGLLLGALLAAPELRTRRVYAADLAGSALGALLVVPAIRLAGAEGSLLVCAFVFLAGVALLARPRGAAARWLMAAGLASVLVGGSASTWVFRLHYPSGTPLAATEGPNPVWKLEHVAWDAIARIELTRITPPEAQGQAYPSLLGSNRDFHQRFRRVFTQNNYAFTYAVDYDGKPESLRGIEETIYHAAYVARSTPAPTVAIIGVGGGFDVLNALAAGASRVTGIEINGATVSLLTKVERSYFRHWVEDPRVKLVNAEGRHYLASHPERFDVIQLSGVDSYSGTAGAAHVFSENYLYTAEAFDLFLSRLSEQGILNVMRLEHPTPREMLKALVLAVEALRRAGVTAPERHLVVLAQPNRAFVALLLKRTPFCPEELARLSEWSERNPHIDVAAAPGRNQARANVYQAFLALGDPGLERQFVRVYPYDIAAPVDDRPFFFRHSFWWHVFPADAAIRASLPALEYSVLLLGLLVSLCCVICVYLPLRFFAARGLATPQVARHCAFFAGCALGYMALEIALLQRFGLFLGHPNVAFSVVLAALLLFTGIGSLLSADIVRRLGRLRFVAYALAVIVIAEQLWLLPRLAAWVAWPLSLRVLLVMLLVAPIGVCLGAFMPVGLERLKLAAPAFVPWAWGINGIFSVLAPLLAIAFSMTWGITVLLLAALPVYILTGFALPEAAPADDSSGD